MTQDIRRGLLQANDLVELFSERSVTVRGRDFGVVVPFIKKKLLLVRSIPRLKHGI